MTTVEHVYIHVPFCSGRCLYCDFHSEQYEEAEADAYLGAVIREIEEAGERYTIRPSTIYLGGGTPSLLSAEQLRRLSDHLHATFDLDGLEEWTIEANPGTLGDDKLEMLQQEGVTRVSIGAQSMDDAVLEYIGRRHSCADTVATVTQLRHAGLTDIGLDLIAGLPGVDRDTWERTLVDTVGLRPTHISVYALSVEAGSKLRLLEQSGDWVRPSTQAEQAALSQAAAHLADAGYQRYEISNYALPGSTCRHNVAVWEGADYIGFGPSASSRLGTIRRTNDGDTEGYCRALEAGLPPPRTDEEVGDETDAAERFMFSMRLFAGVDPHAFARRNGDAAQGLLPHWLEQLSSLSDEGIVSSDGTMWMLTEKGRDFADTVAASLLP